jgi:hypothetical protein
MGMGENRNPFNAHKPGLKTFTGIGLVSAIYFADVFLKASRKCFWFDELVTVYLCRLHDFRSTWAGVVHGADFNPPLLYVFTRGAQRLFGDGLIATRLPAILGVWLLGVCLFFFVARRVGALSGLVAGTFPFFTLAQYYAYEARPHGIVLGWCGLTLICWQRITEGNARKLWLASFGLCVLGALSTHVYAVYILFPFLIAELYSLADNRRPDWSIIAVLVGSLISASVAFYLPLFRSYRATVPIAFFPASHDLIQRFLVTAIGPAIGVLSIALILCALQGSQNTQQAFKLALIPEREVVLAVGFACIPLVGLLGCKISHGPFIERYFLSSIAGYAILLGFAVSCRLATTSMARVLAGCMLLLMIGDLCSTIYLSMKNRIVLVEPSAGFALSTNPANPMQLYDTVSLDQSNFDIMVLRQVNYLYFVRYASPGLVSRLYFGAPANDMFLGIYDTFAKGARVNLNVTTFTAFLATHQSFLVYGSADGRDVESIIDFTAAGYRLKSARPDTAGIMYEYGK